MAIRWTLLAAALAACGGGCAAVPDVTRQPVFHNPFPQLKRMAVLPFYNQSSDPTVDGDAVALAYHNELQKVRGFEVMPPTVARVQMTAAGMEPYTAVDFQKVARLLGVDAVVAGSVTDYSAYYPPRMGLKVNWYAANPGFHPIPPGYGLPWGTGEEEYIPDSLLFEAEFALAEAQLETQAPAMPPQPLPEAPPRAAREASVRLAPPRNILRQTSASEPVDGEEIIGGEEELPAVEPAGWPDPAGFVPDGPSPVRPASQPQYGPIMSLVRQYNGSEGKFTQALENYYYYRDDARFGGWQAYLQRREDFIRFCCYLHITEMLAARGGTSESEVVWRWPFGRYQD